jgi:hypothetical protein
VTATRGALFMLSIGEVALFAPSVDEAGTVLFGSAAFLVSLALHLLAVCAQSHGCCAFLMLVCCGWICVLRCRDSACSKERHGLS